MYKELSFPLNRTRLLLMVIPAPDVVNVLVVTVLLVIVPDAVRFVKPLILLLCIATSAASVIPVMLKLMIGVFNMFTNFIELDFNVSDIALYKYPFTVSLLETVRDGVVIEPLLEIERDDAFIAPVLTFSDATVPVELIYEAVTVPNALILRALKDVEVLWWPASC